MTNAFINVPGNVITTETVVYVVDDDPAVREGVSSLLRSVGQRVVTFSSAPEFLAHPAEDVAACLVLDIRMPGLGGLELQQHLGRARNPLPIVFITGHGDVTTAVRAMKAGAFEFLPKPFHPDQLLDAVNAALRLHASELNARATEAAIRARYARLTIREREVLDAIVAGKLNKQVGTALGVSEQTVKVHRHNIMRKMDAASLPDLVRSIDVLRAAEVRQQP